MNRSRSFISLVAVALFVLCCSLGCEKWRSKDEGKSTAMKSGSQVPSLYQRLGGEPAIRAVVDDFVPRAAADPKVNFAREGIAGVKPWQPTTENVQRVKDMLVLFIGEATGGPQKYTGKDMKSGHKGMKITSAEFDAIATDLRISLEKLKVPKPEQDELMAIVGTTRKEIVEQ